MAENRKEWDGWLGFETERFAWALEYCVEFFVTCERVEILEINRLEYSIGVFTIALTDCPFSSPQVNRD